METGIIGTASDIAFAILSVALVLSVYRLIKGPTLADRVVSLDLMTLLAMAYAALYAVAAKEQAFLDVAIALGLVGFLATVAFARYAERRRFNLPTDDPNSKDAGNEGANS